MRRGESADAVVRYRRLKPSRYPKGFTHCDLPYRMSSVSDDFYCQFCGSTSGLRRCAQCHGIFYCSKEHQRLHWPAHKHICKLTNTHSQRSCASPPPLVVPGSPAARVPSSTPPVTAAAVVDPLATSVAAQIPPDAGIAADIPNYDPNDPVNQAWWNDTLSSLGLGTEGTAGDLANGRKSIM
ncbi:hypothetical protein HPB50_028738 [Hyalomma asiaticum]|nr:hypothetical protein HPB50_028738 [Hyalomma asiaticum]